MYQNLAVNFGGTVDGKKVLQHWSLHGEEDRNGVPVPVQESVEQSQVGRVRNAFRRFSLDDVDDLAASGHHWSPLALHLFVEQDETGEQACIVHVRRHDLRHLDRRCHVVDAVRRAVTFLAIEGPPRRGSTCPSLESVFERRLPAASRASKCQICRRLRR